MRELQVVGLGDDTSTVILEDPIRHERFTIPSDERLRAAARGDIRRLGQMEIETTVPLRPRDIQARVRAGRVGRARWPPGPACRRPGRALRLPGAARALARRRDRQARAPACGGTPDPRTLGEITATTFAGRGQDPSEATWDAWKGEEDAGSSRWRGAPGAPTTSRTGPTPGRERRRRRAPRTSPPATSDAASGPRPPGRGARTAPRLPPGRRARRRGSRRRASPRSPSRAPWPSAAGRPSPARQGPRPARPARCRTSGPRSGAGPPARADAAASPAPDPAPRRRRRARRGQATPALAPDRPVLGGRPARGALAPRRGLISPGAQAAAATTSGQHRRPIPTKAPHTAQRQVGAVRLSHSAGTRPGHHDEVDEHADPAQPGHHRQRQRQVHQQHEPRHERASVSPVAQGVGSVNTVETVPPGRADPDDEAAAAPRARAAGR